MKTKTFVRDFNSESDALRFARELNKHRKSAAFVVVPGPADNYCVVDIATGVDLGLGYKF